MNNVTYANSCVEEIDFMGSDITIVNAARVPFNKHVNKMREFTCEDDERLLNYLAKHEHWSPFARTSIQLRVSAPIFIARQLVKHTVGGVWNEVSRRYVSDNVSFFLPSGWRKKPENAKQGSSGVFEERWLNEELYDKLWKVCITSQCAYDEMIKMGVAPEQARMVLPQNLMTEWYWTGSLMFWFRVCKLHLDNHAQAEAQVIAQQIAAVCAKRFPLSWKALFKTIIK